MRIFGLATALLLVAALSGPAVFAQDGGSVANATFTSNVTDGAPVDFRDQFVNTTPVVYYYGELLGLADQIVKLRWSLEGKRMYEVEVEVTRARQPVWSKMAMQQQWTGDWTVAVLNSNGEVVDQRNFAYSPPL